LTKGESGASCPTNIINIYKGEQMKKMKLAQPKTVDEQIDLYRKARVDMKTGKTVVIEYVGYNNELKGGCRKQLHKMLKRKKIMSVDSYQKLGETIVKKMDPHREMARVIDETKDMIRYGHVKVRRKA
jgi:hypothetical protein